MLIWQGGGILAVFPLVAWALGMHWVESAFGKAWYEAHAGRVDGGILFLSGVVVWFVGRWLNGRPGRLLVDPETNQQVMLKRRHTIFFVPMEYAAVLWVCLGVYGFLFK